MSGTASLRSVRIPLHMPAETTTRSKVDISRVARLLGSETHYVVADKALTDKQIKDLPVRISGQVNPLINSV